jgi:hypothetical protein
MRRTTRRKKRDGVIIMMAKEYEKREIVAASVRVSVNTNVAVT